MYVVFEKQLNNYTCIIIIYIYIYIWIQFYVPFKLFLSVETNQSVGGAKTGVPGEKIIILLPLISCSSLSLL